LQAIFLGLVTGMSIFFSSAVGDPIQLGTIVAYASFESEVVGLLIGYLFQRFYQNSDFVSKTTLADIAYRPLRRV